MYFIEQFYKIARKEYNNKLQLSIKYCTFSYLENFEKIKTQECFGNGRYVRNLFEKIKFEQADRIIKTNNKNINTITTQDVDNALAYIQLNHQPKQKVIGFAC